MEPGPTGLAAAAAARTAGHMDPIISPWSTGISESTGQQLPLLQPLLYRHTVFSHSYTILINMCVHRKLGEAILQAPSVDREWVSERGGQVRSAAHHKSGRRAKVKGLKGLNPDLRALHSKVMHHVCHAMKLKEVWDAATVWIKFNLI